MDEIQNFLSNNRIIKDVVLLIHPENCDYLKDIFNFVQVEHLVVAAKDSSVKEKFERFISESLYYVDSEVEVKLISEFHRIESLKWALCFYDCEEAEVRNFIKYGPSWVVGSVKDSNGSAFRIWEEARMVSDSILIRTNYKDEGKRVLSWSREPENNIELSIIIPMYNMADYIEKCIKPIISWNAGYIEIIVVNDGSTDNCATIVRDLMNRDARIQLIEKENGGCASARKCGLEAARGRYVGFVDPDDFVDEGMFRKLLSAALEGSYDISLCGYNEYYQDTGTIKKAADAIWEPYISGTYDPVKVRELITYARVAIWRGIYRRAFLKECGISFYEDIRRFDDLPFKVETFAFAKSVVIVPEYLYYYRLEREGQDVTANDERLFVHFDIFKHLDESVGGCKNQFINDNLQMCKIQTHRYALSKIEEQFRSAYLERARADLNVLDSFQRTYKIANKMLGDEVAEDYRRIMQSDYGVKKKK